MGASNPAYWTGGLLLAPEAAPAAAERDPHGPLLAPDPDPDALHSRDLDPLASAVASLESGPGLEKLHATISPSPTSRPDSTPPSPRTGNSAATSAR